MLRFLSEGQVKQVTELAKLPWDGIGASVGADHRRLAGERKQLFIDYINSLSQNEKTELLALVLIGREKLGIGDHVWQFCLNYAYHNQAGLGEYLWSKRMLPTYLKRGMETLASQTLNVHVNQ